MPRGRLFHAPRLRRALQTGEVVRIHRERGRNFVCKIIDVLPLAELDEEQRSAWLREKTASQCVVMVQWFELVGDETKLYPRESWVWAPDPDTDPDWVAQRLSTLHWI